MIIEDSDPLEKLNGIIEMILSNDLLILDDARCPFDNINHLVFICMNKLGSLHVLFIIAGYIFPLHWLSERLFSIIVSL